MCGVAGVAWNMAGAPPPLHAVPRMLAARAHRGPDGSGLFEGGGVIIGHRRLSIIDPAGGAQPLHVGSATLAANAEIYNFAELRAAMPHTEFTTHSDCEPALHL